MPDDARDFDQLAEQLDDDVLGDEYPPTRPIGLSDSVDDEEPEDFGDLEDEGDIEIEMGVGIDGGDDELNVAVLEDGDIGALADDDEFTGDETTRDVATERVPPAAEDQAMHVQGDTRRRW
jgi:hypothetical protein